jgi:hypothetical protein
LPILVKFIVPYTNQKINVVEGKNYNFVEIVRCKIHNKWVNFKLCPEAISFATYILICILTRIVRIVIPKESWSDKNPIVAHIKIFGDDSRAHILNEKIMKLEPKNHKCIFIGYDKESKDFCVYNPFINDLIIQRDVHTLMRSFILKMLSFSLMILYVANTNASIKYVGEANVEESS